MGWEKTLKKYDWGKKPLDRPSVGDRYYAGLDKYVKFFEMLYVKMATSELTSNRIKAWAGAAAIEMPKLYEKAKGLVHDARSKELKQLIAYTMREYND